MHTRRQFVTAASSAAAAVILTPEGLAGPGRGRPTAALASGGRFREGVMSGEPTTQGISLWTRVDGLEGRARVELEVARDRDFRRVVARRRITTSEALNHNVKAQVSGLRPHEQYYYRFSTGTEDGPVGRFRTALPADSQQPVRFAFYSCQDYTHGYYNAHEVMADDDLDFVVCLGRLHLRRELPLRAWHEDRGARRRHRAQRAQREHRARGAHAGRLPREVRPVPLRPLAAEGPATLPDDHAVGRPRGPGQLRRRRARRRPRRREALRPAPQARGHAGLLRGLAVLPAAPRARVPQPDLRPHRRADRHGPAPVPRRPALRRRGGPGVRGLRPAARLPRPHAARLGQGPPAGVRRGVEGHGQPAHGHARQVLGASYLTFDNWQGYPREREELLTFIKDRAIKDVVFVTGDIHTFIAGDVRTNDGAGETVALEFVGGSITSQGLGETDIPAGAGGGVVIEGNDVNPSTDPAVIEALRGINTWVDVADFDHHGYGKVEATRDSFDVEFVRVETIKRRSTRTLPSQGYQYRVQRGQTSIKGVNGPPAAAPTA